MRRGEAGESSRHRHIANSNVHEWSGGRSQGLLLVYSSATKSGTNVLQSFSTKRIYCSFTWDILCRKIAGSGQRRARSLNERNVGREKPQTIISILCVLSQQHRAHSAELTHFIPPNAKFISSLPVLISFSLSHSLTLHNPKPDPDVVRMSERNFMCHGTYRVRQSRVFDRFYNALLPHSAFLSLSLLSCLPACLVLLFDDDGTVYPTYNII